MQSPPPGRPRRHHILLPRPRLHVRLLGIPLRNLTPHRHRRSVAHVRPQPQVRHTRVQGRDPETVGITIIAKDSRARVSLVSVQGLATSAAGVRTLRVRDRPVVCRPVRQSPLMVISPGLVRAITPMLRSRECTRPLRAIFLVLIPWHVQRFRTTADARVVATVAETFPAVELVQASGATKAADQVPVHVRDVSTATLPHQVTPLPQAATAAAAVAVAELQVLSAVRAESPRSRVSHAGRSVKNSRR
jgi:hypothetical protein